MSTQITKPDHTIDDKVKLIDMLQLHWSNYEMRQEHFWKSFGRLTIVVVTLWFSNCFGINV